MANFSPSDIARLTGQCIDAAINDGHRVAREQLGEQANAYAMELERQVLEAPRVIVEIDALPPELDSQKMADILLATGFTQDGNRFSYPLSNL